jgi:hypothetical protein
MISIYVWNKLTPDNRHLLHLPDDGNMTLKMSNPFVNDLGTFSYPLTIPYEENKHIFEFPGDGETQEKEFEFDYNIGGELFLQGVVDIIDAEGIEISLRSAKSSVAAQLKSSYLDEAIAGQSWGQRDHESEFEDANTGCYPEYDYCVPPIKNESEIINEMMQIRPDPYSSDFVYELNPDKVSPAVYVRYVIDRVVDVLGFVRDINKLNDFPDINRLFLFSARSNVDDDYSSWLPHITAHDFLKAMEHRFGWFVFFYPNKKYCDILPADYLFSLTPITWTSKFVAKTDIESYLKKTIVLTQDGEPDDIVNTDDLIPDVEYNDFSELPDLTPQPTEEDDSILYAYEDSGKDYIAKVGNEDPRFFKKELLTPETSFPHNEPDLQSQYGIYISKDQQTAIVGHEYYFPTTERPTGTPIEVSNSNTAANQLNEIMQAAFPYPSELNMSPNEAYFSQTVGVTVHVKVNSSAPVSFICELKTLIGDRLLGHKEVILDRDGTEYEIVKVVFRVSRKQYLSGSDRLLLYMYAKASDAGRVITVKFGGLDDTKTFPIASHLWIDPSMFYWKEIGPMGEYKYGDKAESEEIKPDGEVMRNVVAPMHGLFEMPFTTMKREVTQKDFAFSIFRGLQAGQYNTMEGKQVGYANFDTKDLSLADYSNYINGPAPQLSLRWRGNDGIVKKMYENLLFYRRHRWRKVTMTLKLSVADIAYMPIYQPVLIGSQTYIISELSIPINIKKGIQPVTAELLTI